MKVRGAPAIAVAAALGLLIHAKAEQQSGGKLERATAQEAAEWLSLRHLVYVYDDSRTRSLTVSSTIPV